METFQNRLVTELRLSGTSTIGEVNDVLETFLPRFNARFAVPVELSLTGTICIKDTRKVARDNTVKYH